jgi:hypothetical protein
MAGGPSNPVIPPQPVEIRGSANGYDESRRTFSEYSWAARASALLAFCQRNKQHFVKGLRRLSAGLPTARIPSVDRVELDGCMQRSTAFGCVVTRGQAVDVTITSTVARGKWARHRRRPPSS